MSTVLNPDASFELLGRDRSMDDYSTTIHTCNNLQVRKRCLIVEKDWSSECQSRELVTLLFGCLVDFVHALFTDAYAPALMPLTRPKHKNSSRSPGISSTSYFQSSSTPKGFHPPSYYAAAAGLTHPQPDNGRPAEAPMHHTVAADRSLADFDNSFFPAPMPTAQLPTSSSASSTEPSIVSRMSFLNKRLSKATGMGTKSSKRKSQLADLPLVEAQLVPSLRDTIERMTNSPSTPAQPSAFFSHPVSQQNPHDPFPPSSHYQLYPSTPPPRQRSQTGLANAVPTPPTSIPRVPIVVESSRIPTPVAVAKTKPNLKPALKNAIASTSLPSSGQGSHPSPTKASPSRSLKSVKGIIARKTPQIPVDLVPSDNKSVEGGNIAIASSSRLARERSHTDPGHVSRIPSRPPHVHTTPRLPPPVSNLSMPGREPQYIPPNRVYNAINDSSGSELNLQGDRGRALFVTNAVIVPSSSSSSEDVQSIHPASYARVNSPAWSSHMPQPHSAGSAQSGVGLGLGTSTHNAHLNSAHLITNDQPDADTESEYNSDRDGDDADPFVISSSPSSAHLRSLVLNRQVSCPLNLNRQSSSASGGTLPNPWDSSDVKPSEDDQRRQALIELVNEMDNGSLVSAQTYEYDNLSDDEYIGVQGLAISPSENFENKMDATLNPEDENRAYLGRRSPGTSQATPRQQSSAPTSVAFSREHHKYSPLSNRLSALARDPTTEARKKDKGVEFSPLSEYSDEEVQYGPNRIGPFSSQKARRSPLTKDRSSFRSPREGDHPLPSHHSPDRHPIVGIVSPTLTQSYGPGSARSVEKIHRTSGESPATTSLKPNFDATRSQGGVRSRPRVREREVMQFPLARMQDTPLPHADSSSSIERLRWQLEDQDISMGAEAIFGQLGAEHQFVANEGSSTPSQQTGKAQKFSTNSSSKSSSLKEIPDSLPELTIDPSNSRDVPRAYEGTNTVQPLRRVERNSQAFDHEQRTWLSTISSSAYHSLLDRYGEVEIKRQQVIWDLCETERTFVKRLQTFVRLFIRPLRMKDSVAWLAGVPTEVARLFDWLEDIINLHAQISSALRAVVSEQYPIVMRIAGRVRSFVARLEVHQPYVVRLESTAVLIKRMSVEPSDDFGEFIRIQQEQEACHGWSVEAFLVEPVNRLVDYPIHFKRLLDVTPQGHPDHLATLSLLHCTETVIRVMREVKLQEDEYELVKDRLGRIKGFPASLQLAHRSRRLLARGRLERDCPDTKAHSTTVSGEPHGRRRSHQAPGVRQSRLISAIQSRAMRSDSIRTTSESNTSMGSHFFDALQTNPYSPDLFQHSTSASSFERQDSWEHQFSAPRNAHPILESYEKVLYTLVFNDLVLFASPTYNMNSHHNREMQIDSWNLLEGIGISRVLKAIEESSRIVLDLLPVDLENIATGRIPDSGQIIKITLSVPSTSSLGVQLDAPSLSRLGHNWVSAFQECAEYTLRALSFPTQSGKLAAPIPGLAWDRDPQTSGSAILAGGCPLPKSPSTQMAEQDADPAEQEREARGWWALRFQQVLRETQRGSNGALIPASPTPSGNPSARGVHLSREYSNCRPSHRWNL
ncbi:hypothetical protein BC827DRAFT_249515 [Russula dissimulans]|nr:hypothetical protein BC827DRAFT_249515 [Russula dissimulans]